MARLDRLADGKAVAQLGAVLGRTFAYELLQAVAPLDELALWRGLGQLVRGRGALPAGGAAAGHVYVQACPDPGCGLSVAAAEHPAAVPPAHGAGAGRAVSADRRDPARTAGASLHRGGSRRAGRGLLAAGGRAGAMRARPMWKRSRTSPRASRCSRRCRTPPRVPSTS